MPEGEVSPRELRQEIQQGLDDASELKQVQLSESSAADKIGSTLVYTTGADETPAFKNYTAEDLESKHPSTKKRIEDKRAEELYKRNTPLLKQIYGEGEEE